MLPNLSEKLHLADDDENCLWHDLGIESDCIFECVFDDSEVGFKQLSIVLCRHNIDESLCGDILHKRPITFIFDTVEFCRSLFSTIISSGVI